MPPPTHTFPPPVAAVAAQHWGSVQFPHAVASLQAQRLRISDVFTESANAQGSKARTALTVRARPMRVIVAT
jgi:hypothetical protein